jgi:hypothetical protein
MSLLLMHCNYLDVAHLSLRFDERDGLEVHGAEILL